MAEEINRTKICIIGAGPAGAAASIRLSQEKQPHLILDAGIFPRHKACGDIITSGVLRELNRLDPELLPLLKREKLLSPIRRSLIYPPNGKPISLDFLPFDGVKGEDSCYSVSRYDLDLLLTNKLKESPYADFREGVRIKSLEKKPDGILLHSETGKAILAELVIFATGSGGSLLSKLGIEIPQHETAVGVRVHYENVRWNPEETGLFLNPACMPGGLYITPLPGGKCNVNLVLSQKKLRKEKQGLKEKMDTILENTPMLKDAFASSRRLGNPEGSKLCLAIRPRAVSGERFLLTGDAAGLIEFFSGNGIPQAYASGRLAAETAIQSLLSENQSAPFLKQYDKALYRKVKINGIGERIVFPLLHLPFFSGKLLRFLNFLSGRPQTNLLLRDILYARSPGKILIRPGFWYDLLLR